MRMRIEIGGFEIEIGWGMRLGGLERGRGVVEYC